jgi:hypothetical protein
MIQRSKRNVEKGGHTTPKHFQHIGHARLEKYNWYCLLDIYFGIQEGEVSNSSIVLRVKVPGTGWINGILERRKEKRRIQRQQAYSWVGKVEVGKHATLKELRSAPGRMVKMIRDPLSHHKLYHEIRTFIDGLPYHMLPIEGREVRLWKGYDGIPYISIDYLQGFREEWFVNILEELDNRGFVLRAVEDKPNEGLPYKIYRLQRGREKEKVVIMAYLARDAEDCELVKIGEKLVPEYEMRCKGDE